MAYERIDTVVITPALAGISNDIVQDVGNWNVYKTVDAIETFVEEITINPEFPVGEGAVTYTFEYTYIVTDDVGQSVSFRFEPSGTEADLSDAVLGAGNGLDWTMDLGIIIGTIYYKGDTITITPVLAKESNDIVQDVGNWNVYKTVDAVETFVEEITIIPVFPVGEGTVTYTFEYDYTIVEYSGQSVSFRFEPSGTEADLSDAVLGAGNGLDWTMDFGTIVTLFPEYGSMYDYGESPLYKDDEAEAVGVPIITTAAINDSVMVSI